jgi:transcriptional regulator NrdR family protein
MKCPHIKGKKPCGGELLTKRTLANGNKVTRERYCPKCRNRFMTIEQFERDIEAEKARGRERITEMEREIQRLAGEIESNEEIFRGLKAAMERAARTISGCR